MLSGKDITKWFIYHNPELASGYIDENTKINKLLYFSNLMYYCINKENLIDEEFVAFPNGPVIYSVYRDYRYNGLNSLPKEIITPNELQLKVLNIINFVYGNLSTDELVSESHSHSLWKDVSHLIPHNPRIDFQNIEPELVEYNIALYNAYADFDFSNIQKEKINNNIYYYFKDSFCMTEEIIEKLSRLNKNSEPQFLELVNGELVVS